MITNTIKSPYQTISDVFEAASSPIRIQILLAVGMGEACVCHLENLLNLRQAYLSQQLMVLRDAGLVTDRRKGRYIFYSLRNPAILELVKAAARFQDIEMPVIMSPSDCDCPNCRSKS